MPHRVLVARASYRKAYPITMSLRKAGYITLVAFSDRLFISDEISHYAHKYVRVYNPEHSPRKYIYSLIKNIKENNVDVLVPVGYIDFILASKYKEVIEKYAIVPTDNYTKLRNLSNKWYLAKLAKDLNIKFPKTFLITEDNISSINEFIKSTGYPIVVKGISDNSKPRVVSSYRELIKEIKERPSPILLQEFIVGSGVGYFALAYNGDMLAEFMHRRIFESSPLGGASLKACTYHDFSLQHVGRKIVKETKYTGVLMIEFKKDVETGEYYLMEINPKFWGSLELAYIAGVDFPKYLVDFFLKGREPEKQNIKHVCFSWIADASGRYSKYGLKMALQALYLVASKNPLYTDFRLFDPMNLITHSASFFVNIMRSVKLNKSFPKMFITPKLNRNIKNIALIILDLDGTIVNLPINWNDIRKEALNLKLISPYAALSEYLYAYWVNDRIKFKVLSDLIEGHEIKALEKIRENKELAGLMNHLTNEGISIAVVSKQSENVIRKCLSKLGIYRYISNIVGRNTSPLRYDQLCIVAERLGVKKNEDREKTVIFGDTLNDIKSSLQFEGMPWLIASTKLKRVQALELGVSYAENIVDALTYILKYKTKGIEGLKI